MARDVTSIVEPPADPTKQERKFSPVPEAKKPPVAVIAPVRKEIKRWPFEVIAFQDGTAYGPVEVEATDESEAIQRALDGGKFNGLERAKCNYRATCQKQQERVAHNLAAREARNKKRNGNAA